MIWGAPILDTFNITLYCWWYVYDQEIFSTLDFASLFEFTTFWFQRKADLERCSKSIFKLLEISIWNMLKDRKYYFFQSCDELSPSEPFALSGIFSSIIAGEFRRVIGRILATPYPTNTVFSTSFLSIEERVSTLIFQTDAPVV